MVVLALLLAFMTGASAQDDAAEQPDATISTQTDSADDRAIEQRLTGIFAEIEGLGDVTVAVADGVVRLTGRVVSQELADSAGAIARRTHGVVVVENAIEEETAIGERIEPIMDRLSERIAEFVHFLPLLALGILVVVLFWFLGNLVTRREGLFTRLSPNPFIADLWRHGIFLAFILTGGLIAADVMGATALLGSLLGAAGLVGLAIGFAVKDTIENYIATILLSVRQPFAAMDYVEIEGTEGTVARMSSRATILITADGNHVRIPNATVFKAVITNFTRNPERRLAFKVGVDPDCNLGHALTVAEESLRAMEEILETPAPLVVLEELGDFTVIVSASAWIDQRHTDFYKALSEAIRRVKEAYDQAGIAMPVPTYAVTQTTGDGSGPAKEAATIPEESLETRDTSPDKVVAEKAEQERLAGKDDDLLNDNAAQE